MKYIREIFFVVTPFFVVSFMMYLMGSFLSASWNPDEWQRADRAFCLITAWVFGAMLLIRLTHERKNDSD
jgi:hypothetical protein